MTNGTQNTEGIFTMLVDDGGGGNGNKFLAMRSLGRCIFSGCRRGRKGLLVTKSLVVRAFETITFNGNTYDDYVEECIRWGRRFKISGAIEMVLGTLGEQLLKIRPNPIRRKVTNKEMDHLPFLEGNPHGDEARTGNFEFTNVLVEPCKIFKSDIRDMGAKVKLGSDVNTAVKGLKSGPNIAGRSCFSARDDGGDDRGNTALNDVLDLGIFLPPLAIGLEGGRTRIGDDSGHRNRGRGRGDRQSLR